ncbi:hypothetical protein PIROE2DRAFT_11522 [Piromyces sp. E2]|nr:hypothetical protein PIROE2DRAFT_11522 [Piromyces sp. E2]|eukprot:OUM62264.1 hypothetical protein PIROE2DRAFT_11522 [Piromyces sp. E2]
MYICIIITLFFLLKIYAKVFSVKSNDTSFYDFHGFLTSNQQQNNVLELYFEDDYYDISLLDYYYDTTVESNISIIGNQNGTVFDYNNNKRGRLIFNFLSNKGYTLKIKNIIFENFDSMGSAELEFLMINSLKSDKFFLIIENCTFQNNYHRLFKIHFSCTEQTHMNPSSGSEKTMFILIDSGENEHKIVLNNLNIKNGISNGPLIKIMGNSNSFLLTDSIFNKIESFGPVIDDISEKSQNEIKNIQLSENINSNKKDCGNIHFNKHISLSIEDSKFFNNYSESNGGVICVDNIFNINLKLHSNEFKNNMAKNGGALYFKKANVESINEENNIEMYNNSFYNNFADKFGGAIYLDIYEINSMNVENNNITFNKAGINGGGYYIPFIMNNNLNNIQSFHFLNNSIDSLKNDYSSEPSYITLNTELIDNFVNLNSGDYLPLSFTLYDVFGQIFQDITKYYSSITLILSLIDKNSKLRDDYNSDEFVILKGNTGLKDFQIFAKPNDYILKVTIKNSEREIVSKFENITIKVLPCRETQFSIYKNEILFCETAMCKQDCPTNSTATCLPYLENTTIKPINDINKNICKCINGWEGDKCNIKKFVNFR